MQDDFAVYIRSLQMQFRRRLAVRHNRTDLIPGDPSEVSRRHYSQGFMRGGGVPLTTEMRSEDAYVAMLADQHEESAMLNIDSKHSFGFTIPGWNPNALREKYRRKRRLL